MNPVQHSKPDPWLLPGESRGEQPGTPASAATFPPSSPHHNSLLTPEIKKLRASLCCQNIHVCKITALDTRLHGSCEQHLTWLCPACFQLTSLGAPDAPELVPALGCPHSVLPGDTPREHPHLQHLWASDISHHTKAVLQNREILDGACSARKNSSLTQILTDQRERTPFLPLKQLLAPFGAYFVCLFASCLLPASLSSTTAPVNLY